ncbi:SigE family RNA polymerase sigma factor [Catellatospora vulcania]|uniref:SigE family RNA polymerase sigma factor n=1 Tax=Catellatospora vulcania TaxID=1460450 RepID=UPI0012D3C01E|nr:SigE family RNA polymerase sigma factor [Catellatospora vulcania]
MDRYDGFHEFVVARGGALSRTAFLLTGEHHAAEDLVQSALAKAASRWRQIVEYGQPEAYIRRIMINEQISWWRRRPARPVADLPDLPGPDEPHRIVDRVALGEALDTLSPRQRAVVVLRFYEDLSEADTAAVLGCSVGTVKSHTHHALANLRRALPLYAEQAGQYADAPAALVAARRRRSRRAAVVALAIVPLLLTALWYAVRDPADVPPPATVPPSVSPVSLPRLRPRPEQPTSVGNLPADRGIGGASLLLAGSSPGLVQLVGGDGGLYHHFVPAEQLLNAPALSPDGRWLTWTTAQATMVRDLTDTTVRELPPSSGAPFWSPSGGWFLIPATPTRGDLLYRMPDWAAHPLAQAAPEHMTWAVLDSGELLRSARAVSPTAAAFVLAEPFTGAVRQIRVDAAGLLGAGESITAPAAVLPTRIDVQIGVGVAAFRVVREEPVAGTSVGQSVIEFSTVDGRVLRRIDLVPDIVAWVLCYQSGDLLWTDGVNLRRRPAGADHDEVVMPLDPSAAVHPPGCREGGQIAA